MLRDVLKNRDLGRIYVVDESSHCVVFLVVRNCNQYLVAVFRGTNSWYSKVVPAHMVFEPYWKCYYLQYSPEGLYSFAENVSDLVDKVIRVLEKYQRFSADGRWCGNGTI